jgi:hypothetical protein
MPHRQVPLDKIIERRGAEMAGKVVIYGGGGGIFVTGRNERKP